MSDVVTDILYLQEQVQLPDTEEAEAASKKTIIVIS
jgi:hypothetical protein